DYTSEGKLIGHITMGVEIISKAISKHKDFPQDLAIKLKHVMLSHHGQLEYGSPKRPKTMEALVVSYLDDLDAKVNMFSRAITSEDGDENWSPFNRGLERYIYKGGGLEDRPTEPSAKDDKKEGDKKADQNELF
ncbi:MAG: hypothetical protein KAR06_03970, partial [Deltaproteobacteria bacterium]|nr:hypothetical protein [Deltaproteobacteria bacterium]